MTGKEEYIEEVGVFYEKFGLPKMAGRILGCLITSELDGNTFDELQDILKASKGSISGNVKLLLSQQMIEKFTITGDRKSYYRIAMNSLKNIVEAKAKSIVEFRMILDKGLGLNENQESSNYLNISEILDYYRFLEKEMPLLREKWEKMKKKDE